jgi:hypothetical protein
MNQTESISFEFDLHHTPEKVWRALTDPVLLAEWLLPVIDLKLEPGAAFTFKTQAFTLTVIANFVAMTQGQPPAWVTYSPLLPLGLLLFSGLYLFVLPYATKWRQTQ